MVEVTWARHSSSFRDFRNLDIREPFAKHDLIHRYISILSATHLHQSPICVMHIPSRLNGGVVRSLSQVRRVRPQLIYKPTQCRVRLFRLAVAYISHYERESERVRRRKRDTITHMMICDERRGRQTRAFLPRQYPPHRHRANQVGGYEIRTAKPVQSSLSRSRVKP